MSQNFKQKFPLFSNTLLKTLAPLPPVWVASWLENASQINSDLEQGISAAVGNDNLMLTAAVLDRAVALGSHDLKEKTFELYSNLFKYISSLPCQHVIRMWNYIPSICADLENGKQRYCAFNEGRFETMNKVFGQDEVSRKKIPAASAVGFNGKDLVVYALSAIRPGEQMENPNQIPAYKYSKRYGLRPPCFARATRITYPKSALLISGTAAITGEDTQFTNDTKKQCELTCENIVNLIQAANILTNDNVTGANTTNHNSQLLNSLDAIRVYIPNQKDIDLITDFTKNKFINSSTEFIQAELCRKELRVEIEGIVMMDY